MYGCVFLVSHLSVHYVWFIYHIYIQTLTTGTAVGYHAITIGMYMDQLVRRIDPKHRSVPQFFDEEIAKPFGMNSLLF